VKHKTIAERVAELLAQAPPITEEQREAAVRILGPAIRAQAERRAKQPPETGAKAA
jgi:hypothetical protein